MMEEMKTVEYEKIGGELIDTIVRTESSISTSEGELVRKKEKFYHIASCGHVVKSVEELGGKCGYKSCGAICCELCLKTCARCAKTICPVHQKLHGGYAFCPSCWLIAKLFGFKHHVREEERQASPEEKSRLRGLLSKLFSPRR